MKLLITQKYVLFLVLLIAHKGACAEIDATELATAITNMTSDNVYATTIASTLQRAQDNLQKNQLSNEGFKKVIATVEKQFNLISDHVQTAQAIITDAQSSAVPLTKEQASQVRDLTRYVNSLVGPHNPLGELQAAITNAKEVQIASRSILQQLIDLVQPLIDAIKNAISPSSDTTDTPRTNGPDNQRPPSEAPGHEQDSEHEEYQDRPVEEL